jgi:hypothetical protein
MTVTGILFIAVLLNPSFYNACGASAAIYALVEA